MSNDKVDYAEEAGKLTGKAKPKKPKVKKCQYTGCPLKACCVVLGSYTCNFHHHSSGQFHKEITIAIRSNKTFIQAYNKMVNWINNEWNDPVNKKWLLNNKNCAMLKDEPPSLYLVRYFNWLDTKVRAEATAMIGG